MSHNDMNKIDYNAMEDEEVLTYVHSGCKRGMEHLIEKYKPLVRAKARSYFMVGADREDIVQEGMIGLLKLSGIIRIDKSIPFRVFAEMCITRQIITAVKTATRQKHIPLNSMFRSTRRYLMKNLISFDRSDRGESLQQILRSFLSTKSSSRLLKAV